MSAQQIDGTLLNTISDKVVDLYLNEANADIVFVSGIERFLAHRNILRRHSTYFRKTNIDNSKEVIEIMLNSKVKISSFKLFLKYFYSGVFDCTEMDITDVYDSLLLGKTYEVPKLVDQITGYLIESVSLNNLTTALNYYKKHNSFELHEATIKCLKINAMAFVKSEYFNNLSEDALVSLLELRHFPAKENELLKAVVNWQHKNPTLNKTKILSLIHISLVEVNEWLNALSADVFDDFKFLETINDDLKLINRGLLPEVNVASSEFEANYIEGDNGVNLPIRPDKFVFQTTVNTDSAIKIQLGRAHFVNHIEFNSIHELLFGYFIEVSLDNKIWDRIIDYSTYTCYSKQSLFFEGKFIKFIKIVGILVEKNAKNYFGISNLVVKYSEPVPRLVNGFVAPSENIFYSAKVKINGRLQNPLQECFEITNYNGIMDIEFSQPFWIGSFALDATSFQPTSCSIIEIKSGKIVVDSTLLKWEKQQFSLDKMPINGLKIKLGNYSYGITLKNIECPSQDSEEE